MQSKKNRFDEEEDEADNNEFLEGISQINVKVSPLKEEAKATEFEQKDTPEKHLDEDENNNTISEQSEPSESSGSGKELQENDDIKELDDIMGEVFISLKSSKSIVPTNAHFDSAHGRRTLSVGSNLTIC